MRVGIIGTGQMGGMLARSFARSGLSPLTVYTRTSEKAVKIQCEFPDQIYLATSTEDVIARTDLLFLCTKSPEAHTWITEWGQKVSAEQCLITINSQIPLAELKKHVRSQVAKVIPSISQTALAGHLLYMTDESIKDNTLVALENLLNRIGQPIKIQEQDTRIYADLTSCGPAFFATLIQAMAEAAQMRGVPRITAEKLILETAYSLTLLVKNQNLTILDVIQKVSVPGGVTEAGVQLLNQEELPIFIQLFEKTSSRQEALDKK